MISDAPDTTLDDGRGVCIIRAEELQAGDVILANERIDLHITSVRYPTSGYVVADYTCTAGNGARSLNAQSLVAIKPRTEENPH